MKRGWAFGCALAAVAAANAQQPLYRADQPAVMEREATGDANQWDAVLAKFSRSYAAAGRPRMLVMWHRAVSDSFSDEQRVTRSVASVGVLARDTYAQEVTLSWQQRKGPAGSFLAPVQAADYESGLTQSLLSAGVRLVDRNVAVRMTALKGTAGGKAAAGMDGATVEAQAFADLADQILQVQLLPDANAPVGWRARLTVIEVATGRTLADSVVNATQQRRAADVERSYVATSKGFEVQAAPVSLERVARGDVMALMKAMAP